MKPSLLLLALLSSVVIAADLPPDKGNEIPESAKRPVVVRSEIRDQKSEVPKADLPEGYTLSLAAAAPLVTHPIMGCLDDKGRLFIGDGVGVNWNKAQLEANSPNRVLMLEDTDNDGAFDKSTIFADKMTFPQGAAWLDGSLYVCSPPGVWKLTDTDGDGVADQREMIVSGFDYTGNAADVHGPFLNPTNGRLYWCHGRKGHKATDRDGKVVHEGLACGIWSCKPDGRDLQWHSLGCGDNPVEVDFTPDGDIIGVQNLYYTNPRGDTLVHWLYGGVYERSDQFKAIEGLPRTLEHMPVMYNFGHVAVSGSCFWKSYGGAPLQFMVTHFNTQRVVRMELTPDGATYKATENEFLKLHSPDIHFTDVMEDPRDGSLLVVDTGGWFRIGCPSSLMAKPDIAGAIYRVKAKTLHQRHQDVSQIAATFSEKQIIGMLGSSDSFAVRHACDEIARNRYSSAGLNEALRSLLERPLDPALEHAVIQAARTNPLLYAQTPTNGYPPLLQRRLLRVLTGDAATKEAMKHLDADDADLARTARDIVLCDANAEPLVTPLLLHWFSTPDVSAKREQALETLTQAWAGKPGANALLVAMLGHPIISIESAALRTLANAPGMIEDEKLVSALEHVIADADFDVDFLNALKHVKTSRFDTKLLAFANDTKQPQSLRLKALDAMSTRKITGDTFTMVLEVLTKPASSAAAKIQAAEMLAHSSHTKDEQMQLAKAFATVGPIELKSLLALIKPCKEEDVLRVFATELAKNPSLISQQESLYRTAFTDKPTDIFETILLPAYRKSYEAIDAKKRTLPSLADKALASGDAKAGQAVYESGKGTCIACHQIGDKGRSIGPNLSHIGGIRTERDLLESILFPSNTLARDYEAHIIEMIGGETITGVIKSHTAEGLLVVDVAGIEHNVPQAKMVSDTQLTTSLMPMGLDTTLPEKDLLDLVAYLRSQK